MQTDSRTAGAPPGSAPPGGSGRSTLDLARWVEEVHDAVKLKYFDDWVEMVAEQKPLIEQLMSRGSTANPLAAVLPVFKMMPVDDPCRLILIAVAAEMIMRGPNGDYPTGSDNRNRT